MDTDSSDFPHETDSSEEGGDDDLSHLGAAQTTVKSFTSRQETYHMVEQGSKRQKLTDTVLRSCSSAAGAVVPTTGQEVSEKIHQLLPSGGTNIIQQNFLQVQQQFGDVTVDGARNLTIGGTQNIGKPGPSQEEEKPWTWTKKIRERTKSRIEEWTHGMVKASSLTRVMEKLTSGVTWVTVKGSPGEGKTTTAFMALEELHRSERQVFQVEIPQEFSEVTSTCSKPVIMLDDILGNLEFDQMEWLKWKAVLHPILAVKEHRSHEKRTHMSKEKEVTVILVGRDYVLNSVSSDMGRLSDYITSDAHVVDMSNTVERDIQEQLDIWKAISEPSGIELDQKTIDTICHINVPHGFPHVCRLFVTMRQKDPKIDAERFFKSPLDFLNQTVQRFMHDKEKLSLFKEMIKKNGKVSIRELEDDDKLADTIDAAESLVGTYLNKEDGNFTFNHPSIYDSVAFNLCKRFTKYVIENCHLSFLHERIRLDPQHATTSSEPDLVVYIPRCYITDLAKRFAFEISKRNFMLVLSHKALTDQIFIQELMNRIALPLAQLLKLTDKQTKKSFLSLVASSKSPQLLQYIDNQTNIQLTERGINTVLYGVCEYAASDVLTYLEQSCDTLDINVRYQYGETPVLIASRTRDSQFILQIMSLGPDLNARYSGDQTLLHRLCMIGLETAVELVIDSGVDIDVKDRGGWSPLYWACWFNKEEVVRLLLYRGAKIDADTVVRACESGNLDIITLLYESGATFNMTANSDTPLTAASEGGHVKVMRFLIDKGASVNTATASDWYPLHAACDNNKPEAVQCLLDNGTVLDSRTSYGNTPLHTAAGSRSKDCVSLLLEAGIDVNVQNKDGNTPLHSAARNRSKDCVSVILKAGAVIDTTDRQGQTALHKAVCCDKYGPIYLPDISVCQTLITQGADVNKQDTEGNTPLHLLCQVDREETEVYKVLYKYMPSKCKPAYIYTNKFRRVVKLFVDHGADREIKNNRGTSALRGWCKTLLD